MSSLNGNVTCENSVGYLSFFFKYLCYVQVVAKDAAKYI